MLRLHYNNNDIKKMIQRLLLLLIFSLSMQTIYAAPSTSWYLDELGDATASYTLDDDLGGNDGIAYVTPSTGNAAGKVCSALDFSSNSTNDYAKLGKSSLDGATDFTISVWHRGSSVNGRSLLSGARTGQDNELLMWIPNGSTQFDGYINGAAAPRITFPTIADNQWHHLVWRRAGTQSCFFTDGVQRGCSTIQSKTLQIESLILAQEQDNVGGAFSVAQDWEGKLDEMLIFRSALTNAEIQSVYTNQNAGNSWNGSARTCQTNPPPPPPTDYGYSDWHFDEASWNGSANEVVDSHGTNHGIGYSVTAVPGKICNAMDLSTNSTADYAKLGAASLDGVGDFTVSIWHKGASVNGRSLLSGAVSGSTNELILWFNPSTTFNGHLNGVSLGGVTTASYTNNAWHHLVWQRSGNQSCFYLDAQLQGCQTKTDSTLLSISSLVLGQEQDTVGGGFDINQDWEGLVDELLIFRRALNTTDITSIYNNQNSGKNWDGSYRACPNMPAMKVTKTSLVISDPVNLTNNPKRIPGAHIRYSITAENSHATFAENVNIQDDLSAQITAGKIIWLSNMSVTSPNINGGVVSSLTDATGDDQGDFVSNNLTVRCGNISNAAPCTVTYDVEVTQ